MDHIKKLVTTQDAYRDVQWEIDFLKALTEGKVNLIEEEPKMGPDNWPYMFLQFDEGTDQEDASKILGWCTQKGLGVAVNPQKVAPDYVLPFGMLWYFRETGTFFTETEPVQNGQLVVEKGAKIFTGEPTPEYLPLYVRAILKEFFGQQGLSDVKVIMVSTDQKHYDLCISIESLGNPPAEEHKGICEAISWFLPLHYSLVLISEENLPEFVSL